MGKYFKYAIGEIILVVIGILIALQINNWNEKRKIRANEVNILNNLKSDLQKNEAEVHEIITALQESTNNSDKLLRFLSSESEETDSITIWVNGINRNPIFNNANTTYNNIENNSNSFISNDSLRLRITWMYEREFTNIQRRENNYITVFFSEYLKQWRENFVISSTEKDGKIFFNYLTPKNIEQLKNNDTYKNTLVDVNRFMKIRTRFLNLTIERLDQLILDIDKELNKLN